MNQQDSDHALALLLSQQYDEDDYNTPDLNDDDYSTKGKKSKSKSKDASRAKIKTPKIKAQKPKEDGMNTGKFTDLEIEKFKAGLELFGRDWQSLSKYVETRDSNACKSHAQKYFIKLFRDQIALPAKVVESGSGYTLSGKELDPESAAAKPYLKDWKPVGDMNQSLNLPANPVGKTPKQVKEPKPKKQKVEEVENDGERTEYSLNRPVRQRKTFDPITVAMLGY